MKTIDENKNGKERKYTLAYGFRRFSACKKLGWNRIPVFIQTENVVKEVSLDEIFLPENTRLDDKSETFIALMQSIKQHGLLEPIGVWNTKDLTEKDYLILNLIENVQRENISPFGLSQAVKRLNQLGLTNGEIAVRLSMPKSRIEDVVRLTNKLPEKLMKQASYIGENKRDTVGKLPIAVVNAISHLRIPNENKNIKVLVNAAKKEAITLNEIEIVGRLIQNGMGVEKAIKHRKEYTRVHPSLVVINKRWKEKFGDKKSYTEVIRAMISGKIPLDTKLFYYDKEL